MKPASAITPLSSGNDCDRHSLASRTSTERAVAVVVVVNGTVAAVNLEPIIYWIIKTGRVVRKLKSHAAGSLASTAPCRFTAKEKQPKANTASRHKHTYVMYTLEQESFPLYIP